MKEVFRLICEYIDIHKKVDAMQNDVNKLHNKLRIAKSRIKGEVLMGNESLVYGSHIFMFDYQTNDVTVKTAHDYVFIDEDNSSMQINSNQRQLLDEIIMQRTLVYRAQEDLLQLEKCKSMMIDKIMSLKNLEEKRYIKDNYVFEVFLVEGGYSYSLTKRVVKYAS